MRALEKFRTILCSSVAAIFTVGMAEAGLVNFAGSEWGFAGGTGKAARFVQFRSDGKVGGHSGCKRPPTLSNRLRNSVHNEIRLRTPPTAARQVNQVERAEIDVCSVSFGDISATLEEVCSAPFSTHHAEAFDFRSVPIVLKKSGVSLGRRRR